MKKNKKLALLSTGALLAAAVAAVPAVAASEPITVKEVQSVPYSVYKVNVDETKIPKDATVMVKEGDFIIMTHDSETVVDTNMEGFEFFAVRSTTGDITTAYPVKSMLFGSTLILKTEDYDNLYVKTFTPDILDVNPEKHAFSEIENLVAFNVVNGSSIKYKPEEMVYTTKINPDAKITRTEFALIVGRALEAQSDSTVNFSDVKSTDPVAKFLSALNELKIIVGSNGKFNGKDNVTREQAAAIVCRTLRELGVDTTPSGSSIVTFKDAKKISSYALKDITFLAEQGIISSGHNVSFNPKSAITRNDAFKILGSGLYTAGLYSYYPTMGPNEQ